MSQYLLSTYAVEGEVPGAPRTPEQMRAFMERVMALEAEMDAHGAFVYGGALNGPDVARVARPSGNGVLTTDGPFLEPKEQVGASEDVGVVERSSQLEECRVERKRDGDQQRGRHHLGVHAGPCARVAGSGAAPTVMTILPRACLPSR